MDEFCEENRARSGVGAFITCAQNDGPSGAAGAVFRKHSGSQGGYRPERIPTCPFAECSRLVKRQRNAYLR